MTQELGRERTHATARRFYVVALVRVFATSAVLIGLYYVVPLNSMDDVPVVIPLIGGLIILVAVSVFQIRAILSSDHPSVRALEALASTIPWFIVLFAASYYVTSRASPGSFNAESMTRTDTLYFTITVLTTVGFGDITATSQSTRLLVSAQMILDLILLGLGIRVISRAVNIGQARQKVEDPLEVTAAEEAADGSP
jgi:hypothetical protein